MVWTNAYELLFPDSVLGLSLYHFPAIFGEWAMGVTSYISLTFAPLTHPDWANNPASVDFSPAKVKFRQQRPGIGGDVGIGANIQHSLGWYLGKSTAYTLGEAIANADIELQFENLPGSYTRPIPVVDPTIPNTAADIEAQARLRRATGLGDFAASFIGLFDISWLLDTVRSIIKGIFGVIGSW